MKSKTITTVEQLSKMAREIYDHEEFSLNYSELNIIGQYLDQVIAGTPVDQLQKITTLDYVAKDSSVWAIFGVVADASLYQEAVSELEELGAYQAWEFMKEQEEQGDTGIWTEIRAGYNAYLSTTKTDKYVIQIEWSKNPFQFSPRVLK